MRSMTPSQSFVHCLAGVFLSLAPGCGSSATDASPQDMPTAPPSIWQQRSRVTASTPQAGEQFGMAVALSGDTALIGAPNAIVAGMPAAGAVDVFRFDGNSLIFQERLTAPIPGAYDGFGSAVAISENRAVIGAYLADRAGGIDTGTAYVYERAGGAWLLRQEITPTTGASHDFFGASVAMAGDSILIGARGADVAKQDDAGAAYLFKFTGPSWVEQTKFIASEATKDAQLGVSVSLSGNDAMIGAYQAREMGMAAAGAAYSFDVSAGTEARLTKLAPVIAAPQERFGISLSVFNDTALIGTYPSDGAGNATQGTAYVCLRDKGAWSAPQRLSALEILLGARLGSSVALSAETALVAAPNAITPGQGAAGAVYLFDRPRSMWSTPQRLTGRESGYGDQFGAAMAVHQRVVLVGAFGADVGPAQDAGAAYLFLPN